MRRYQISIRGFASQVLDQEALQSWMEMKFRFLYAYERFLMNGAGGGQKDYFGNSRA